MGDHRNDIGDATELLVADRLKDHGIGVKRLFLGGCDLVTDNGIRIEVKASCRNRDGWHRATVNDRWQQATKHADFIVFIAWEDTQAHIFAIPTERVNVKRISLKTSGYAGKWTKYRVTWESLAQILK